MEITLNTPALLFPAISLVLLAYTNRFLGLSSLVRTLHEKYLTNKDLLKEIHLSKNTYCKYTDKAFADYDLIVTSVEKINIQI
jgi:hypothetical protein